MPKLFALDSGTVREIYKLFGKDGATPRRIKKLFGLDGSTVRLLFEDFSLFSATGTSNLIQSPVNEVVDFGVRSDFDSGPSTLTINASGSGDASNVGGLSGLSIDVDSSHTYTTDSTQTVQFDWDGAGTGTARPRVPSGKTVVISGSVLSAGTTLTASQTQTIFGSTMQNVTELRVNNATGNSGTTPVTVTSFPASSFFSGDRRITHKSVRFTSIGMQNEGITYQPSQGRVTPFRYFQPINYSDGNAEYGTPNSFSRSYYSAGANPTPAWVKVSGITVRTTNTGRRARVVNGSTKILNITGGGLTAGGNFTTGNLSAGASTSFVTANSTSEAWTLAGTVTQSPATYSISNNDGDISVSGTFTANSNATTARDAIQAALNANSTFVSKFNTGTDIDKTVSGVAHKVVRFTSDVAENTSDFSMTITQNDGSNTTPHEETVTQGAVESLQTQVQVTRDVEGTEVSSTKSISSQANTDTAGAEVATLGGDISYDTSTNKLKVQDRDATVTVTNAGTLSFTKE